MTFEFYLLNTSGSGSRYFYFSPARLSRDRTRKVWRKKIPQPSGEDDFLSANPARGLTLTGYTGHGTTFAGWEIKYTVVCFAWSVAILFLICSPLPDKWCIFVISNFRLMENYIKKAADAFLVERPYGMRVDYRKKGFVLFNRNLNVLGNAEQTRLEELPLERFNVEEIPLEGEVVEEHAGFTDVFFYTDLTNPYAGYVLNLQKLKAYNRFMFPLAMALNREL